MELKKDTTSQTYNLIMLNMRMVFKTILGFCQWFSGVGQGGMYPCDYDMYIYTSYSQFEHDKRGLKRVDPAWES